MVHDGKALEALVAYVEGLHLAEGFAVRTNSRVFNDEGVQIAEFDIEIRGKVGTTEFSWLIECRDRPTSGPAPGSWIEQLVGRRQRFGFNKVTAVSTTGFAAGASDFARAQGIELREVASLDPSEFAHWLAVNAIRSVNRVSDVKHANVFLAADQPQATLEAAAALVRTIDGQARFLKSVTSGERLRMSDAFLTVTAHLPNVFDDVTPERPKDVRIVARYTPSDYFFIETAAGPARIEEIEFFGQLRIEESLIPLAATVEYRNMQDSHSISQTAAFAPHRLGDLRFAIELHRLGESGETHVTLRRLGDAA